MFLTIIYYLKWLLSYSDYHIASRTVSWYGYHTVRSKSFNPPRDARDLTVDIEYYVNNKRYRYMTEDPDYRWPPEQSQATGMRFRPPIRCVYTLDEDDKPIEDVTEIYREYSGPRGDTPFPAHKVFPFDKKLKVTDVLNNSNVVNLLGEEEPEVSKVGDVVL
jgi:hypothetical protein